MSSVREARNTIYFKAFNDDYQLGGIYHRLSLVGLRTYVILQAYANSRGEIINADGKGYNKAELQSMLDLDYRSLLRAEQELVEARVIKGMDNGGILLVNFVEDNVYRDANKRATRGRRLITEQAAQANANSEKAKDNSEKALETAEEAKRIALMNIDIKEEGENE